jgi:hypothetical protein
VRWKAETTVAASFPRAGHVHVDGPGIPLERNPRLHGVDGVAGAHGDRDARLRGEVVQVLLPDHEALGDDRGEGRDLAQRDQRRSALQFRRVPAERADLHGGLAGVGSSPRAAGRLDGGKAFGARALEHLQDRPLAGQRLPGRLAVGVARGVAPPFRIEVGQGELADVVDLEVSPDQRVGRSLGQGRGEAHLARTGLVESGVVPAVVREGAPGLAVTQRLEANREPACDALGVRLPLQHRCLFDAHGLVVRRTRACDEPRRAGQAHGDRGDHHRGRAVPGP